MAAWASESPLPYFLASSTAYSFIASHQWQYQLLPLFVATWGFAFFVYVFCWLSWVYPYYVSEFRHIPTVPGFPLWGHVFTLVREEHGAPQRRWHNQHGPVVRYFLPFGSERLTIIEGNMCRDSLLSATTEVTLEHTQIRDVGVPECER